MGQVGRIRRREGGSVSKIIAPEVGVINYPGAPCWEVFQAGGWRVTEAAEVDVGMHAKKLNGRLCHSSFFPAYMYCSSAHQMADHPGTKFRFET